MNLPDIVKRYHEWRERWLSIDHYSDPLPDNADNFIRFLKESNYVISIEEKK